MPITNQITPKACFHDLLVQVMTHLNRLQDSVKRAEWCASKSKQILKLLEALPLSSNEFDVASSRLANSRRYFFDGELGASTWELQQLHNSLHNSL